MSTTNTRGAQALSILSNNKSRLPVRYGARDLLKDFPSVKSKAMAIKSDVPDEEIEATVARIDGMLPYINDLLDYFRSNSVPASDTEIRRNVAGIIPLFPTISKADPMFTAGLSAFIADKQPTVLTLEIGCYKLPETTEFLSIKAATQAIADAKKSINEMWAEAKHLKQSLIDRKETLLGLRVERCLNFMLSIARTSNYTYDQVISKAKSGYDDDVVAKAQRQFGLDATEANKEWRVFCTQDYSRRLALPSKMEDGANG